MPQEKRGKRRAKKRAWFENFEIFQTKRQGKLSKFWYFKDQNGAVVPTGTANKTEAGIIAERAWLRHYEPEKAKTFAELALDYGQSRIDQGRPLSDSETSWIAELSDWLGDMLIVDVKPAHIREFADTKKYKNQTKRRQIYTPFLAVRNMASDVIDLPNYTFRAPKAAPTKARPYADEAWIQAFLDTCADSSQDNRRKRYADTYIRLGATVQLCWQTGWRISAVLEGHPDIENKRYWMEDSKSTDAQFVALSDETIRWLRMAQAVRGNGPLLFLDRTKITGPCRTICKHAGIQYMSSHEWGRKAADIRKARIAAKLGVTRADLNHSLGYSASSDILDDVYYEAEQEKVAQLQRS